jgi:hypothetical protein
MGKSKARANATAVTRFVDMWAFLGMHPTNVDLLQRLRSADDRQFGANMDVCGDITQEDPETGKWEENHLIGIRSDIWDPDEEELQKKLNSLKEDRKEQLRRELKRSGRLDAKQSYKLGKQLNRDRLMRMKPSDLSHRRLVMKMFRSTGERIRWVGTIEEITTREVHNSIGCGRPALSLAVLLPGYDYVINIQQNHRFWRIPSTFTLSFFDDDDNRMRYVAIKRKWVSFGADFDIESGGRKIGLIDGRLFGFGYNAQIRIDDPALADNRRFLDMITLFTATIGYHRQMRKSVKRRVRATLAGASFQHVVEDEEFWLLKNPRRRAA